MIPRNPKPLKSAADISLGSVATMKTGISIPEDLVDDRGAILDAILDADALIFATPVYSHQPPGFLKAVTDRILGPFTDAAFVQSALERKQAGDPKFKDQAIDVRVLKPRVVGFLAVSGSPRNEHITMALPTLHQFVYPIHAKVVDQVVLPGFASPGSVIFKDGGWAVERAKMLGRNVASQLGKEFDNAVYLGAEPAGSCPYCHLAKLDFFGGSGNEIGCVVCGARGKLAVENNEIKPVWGPDSSWSCITMEGKQLHLHHVQEAGMEEAKALQSFDPAKFETVRESLLDTGIPILSLPSAKPESKLEPTTTSKGYLSLLLDMIRSVYRRGEKPRV
jgi:multimeric flavodoxin WrbA